MFEDKKIEKLEKRCKTLQEDNVQLNKQVNELKDKLDKCANLVEAANHYTEEHQLAMRTMAESKERYELAYKQMMKIKKEYEKRMENVLKNFE